jgi:hypothetical protein
MQDSSVPAYVNASLLHLREKLSQQDSQGTNDALLRLEASGSAQVIMEQLSPYIFRPNESNDDETLITSHESLSILSLLVSRDPFKYLQPASVAVRKEALCLASTPNALMAVSPELLAVIIQQLSSGMTGVSSQADETLVACCRKLGEEHLGMTALQALIVAWRRAWNGADQDGNNSAPTSTEASTICVRCASSIAEIATLGDDFMRAANSSGALILILQMLGDENDVLLEMASLDIVEKLITTRPMHQERAQWLYSEAVLLPLLEMAGSESVSDPVLGGPALRVLSQLCKLAHGDTELFGQAGDFLLKGFYQALHHYDVSGELDRLAMIDAISSFAGASPDALQLVLDDPVTRQHWLTLSVAQSKLKAAILHSIAMVLDPPLELDANGDTVTPANNMSRNFDDESGRRLYFTFGQVNNDEPTKLVLALARSPLPELRLGAYALLTAVAKLTPGPQVLLGDAQFLEFLLSRPPHETIKEGREAKFTLVKTIYNSNVKGLLADNIVKQLEKYIGQGAHFVESVTWELATED